MHPRGMSSSCHRKEDVLVLECPHLYTSTCFRNFVQGVCGKMLIAKELRGK